MAEMNKHIYIQNIWILSYIHVIISDKRYEYIDNPLVAGRFPSQKVSSAVLTSKYCSTYANLKTKEHYKITVDLILECQKLFTCSNHARAYASQF